MQNLPSVAPSSQTTQLAPSVYLGSTSAGIRSEPRIFSTVRLELGLSLARSCCVIDELGDNGS